ncbi:Uncharacterised protein [Mycobacterium tuberculosis]|nr:Uncharacterised protein [Mycobacterium tuberculosis]
MHLINRAHTVNDAVRAVSVLAGNLLERAVNTRLERRALSLNAVDGAALVHALLLGTQRHAQQQGCVGNQIGGSPAAQIDNGLNAQVTAYALVRGRRINIAIAQHDGALSERGANQLGGVRRAGRRENQCLGAVVNSALTCLKDERSQLFANLGAAGFAGGDDTVSAVA